MRSFKMPCSGDHVIDLQRALVSRGYTLPRFGTDGAMSVGGETATALAAWALDAGVYGAQDGLNDAEVQEAAERVMREAGEAPSHPCMRKLVGASKLVKGMRPWTSIDAIVLHQTGCSGLMWRDVPIHVGIPRDENHFYSLQPLQALLYHANGFNARSIGIEIEGNFCGIEGKPQTHWKQGGGPHTLQENQILHARSAIQWICETVRAMGGEIRYIFAHRQASKDRIADPGEKIWKEVGLWSISTLKLNDGGVGFKVDRRRTSVRVLAVVDKSPKLGS
jgi:hypothetical protein